ncbi:MULTISPECIES: flagellar protein FlaG [Clostridium]|uniref:flagellar protein FlaG n=1 Tax=Clostridium TaxID=1485 RepID=UPI0005FBDF8A|nr:MULTISPECIES: flagellar protein FlaG [Clostridium]KJZ82821.1 Flagellin [Clostridium sp. IBUN22A]KJZ87585.1 Flagellin [Clostridium sp. IBUN125C]KJZ92622.1 Flagellin [Clostridium sp. IBUN62F]KJZ97641.1 hypothetical protein ClosIBUN13A_CONTIG111g01487 [Clostridium sp. IBUN13A]MDU0322327.1 flagellar protein FlaG [Clostridium butyricum]
MDVKNNIINNINMIKNYDIVENNLSEQSEGLIERRIVTSESVKQQFTSDNSSDSKKHDEYTKKDLDDALKKVNNFLKDEKTHAEYSIHKDFGTLMIKIVDDESNKVILEIPPKTILDMVASMCRQVGLLDKKV